MIILIYTTTNNDNTIYIITITQKPTDGFVEIISIYLSFYLFRSRFKLTNCLIS